MGFGGNSLSSYWTQQMEVGSVIGNNSFIKIASGLKGDGYIKAYYTGLGIMDVTAACIALHNSETLPSTADFTQLSAYLYFHHFQGRMNTGYYAENIDQGIDFNNSYVTRIRRENNIVYWEYSTDDSVWVSLRNETLSGDLCAAIYFLTSSGDTQLKTIKIRFDNIDTLMMCNGNMRFLVPRGFVDNNKVILYSHGSSENQDSFYTDPLKASTLSAFTSEKWGVLSCYAHGNNWGNQDSLDDYNALITWAKTKYNFASLDIYAQSMGGLSAMQLFMSDIQFNKFIGIYPALNLANLFLSFNASIKSAYGFSDDADYGTTTSGHDPLLLSGASLNNRKIELVASASDTIVNKVNNTDLFNATFGLLAQITVVVTTGDHGDPSCFSETRDVAFLKS
jgi:hypothetical protein